MPAYYSGSQSVQKGRVGALVQLGARLCRAADCGERHRAAGVL